MSTFDPCVSGGVLTPGSSRSGVNTARADLCEILAIKMLSIYGTSSTSSEHLYVLTAPFNPWAGCTLDMFSTNEVSQEMLDEMVAEGKEDATNALELAIGSQARRFIRSPLVQHVVKAIYEGDVMYSLESNQFVPSPYSCCCLSSPFRCRQRSYHGQVQIETCRRDLRLAGETLPRSLPLASSVRSQDSRVDRFLERLSLVHDYPR